MVRTVSAQSSGARKAAKQLRATSSPHTHVGAVPAIAPTDEDGWAYFKSKEGIALAEAIKKAASELLQSDYITRDAPLLAAGLQAHAEHRIKYANFVCNNNTLWDIAPQHVQKLVSKYCDLEKALTNMENATSRSATVLWS
jgi:hypothetical protein